MSRLILWQETQDYQTKVEDANSKLQEITRLFSRKGIRQAPHRLNFDRNTAPIFYLNSHLAFRVRDVDTALKIAAETGYLGWWHFEDLEALTRKEGPIFDQAMWSMGFRKRLKGSSWVKRKNSDPEELNPTIKYLEKDNKYFMELSDLEEERLGLIWKISNENAGTSETYSIEANNLNMIYFHLWANPFADGGRIERLGELSRQFAQRAHVATAQKGFSLQAHNVRIDGKEGVYVKATASENNYWERVLPSEVSARNLADTLNSIFVSD